VVTGRRLVAAVMFVVIISFVLILVVVVTRVQGQPRLEFLEGHPPPTGPHDPTGQLPSARCVGLV
jgi:hypothetical protein